MAEHLNPPDDLIALKVEWLAARALADSIAAEPAAGPDEDMIEVAPISRHGAPRFIRQPSPDQVARLEAVRERVRELTMAIHRHPWKQNPPVGDKYKAELALSARAEAVFRDANQTAAA